MNFSLSNVGSAGAAAALGAGNAESAVKAKERPDNRGFGIVRVLRMKRVFGRQLLN